jgi:hypothetical protein
MARRFGTDINLLGFSLLQAMLHPVSSNPAGLTTGDKGRVWFNTTSNKLLVWNGSAAIDFLDRANHTGSQVASTISDLAAVVQAYSLSSFAVAAANISMGGFRITNVADPSSAQDAATRAYVDAAFASLASGQTLKGTVRVAATTNVNIASAPASIDGVTLVSGQDVVLLTAQTTGSQGGAYLFNGTGNAMTRVSNWDSSAEAVLGSYWIVREGTNADRFALLTNDTAIVMGTTTPTFTFIYAGGGGGSYTGGAGLLLSGSDFSIGAGTGITVLTDSVAVDTAVVVRKVGGLIPAATAGIFTISGSNVTVNHGLGNTSPQIQVYADSTPVSGYTAQEPVEMGYVVVDSNNITVTLPAAPATNNWRISVQG